MPSLREASLRHARYYEAVLRTADRLYLRGGKDARQGLRLFDAEWLNIHAGQIYAQRYDDATGTQLR